MIDVAQSERAAHGLVRLGFGVALVAGSNPASVRIFISQSSQIIFFFLFGRALEPNSTISILVTLVLIYIHLISRVEMTGLQFGRDIGRRFMIRHILVCIVSAS